MSKVWKSLGKIVKNDEGKIIICDDCPCVASDCPIIDAHPSGPFPTTFAVTYDLFGDTGSGTITRLDPAGATCRATWTFPGIIEECWWYGELSVGAISLDFPRIFLYVGTVISSGAIGFQPRWTITWGYRMNVPASLVCNFQGDYGKSPEAVWTTELPQGTYAVPGSGGTPPNFVVS